MALLLANKPHLWRGRWVEPIVCGAVFDGWWCGARSTAPDIGSHGFGSDPLSAYQWWTRFQRNPIGVAYAIPPDGFPEPCPGDSSRIYLAWMWVKAKVLPTPATAGEG